MTQQITDINGETITVSSRVLNAAINQARGPLAQTSIPLDMLDTGVASAVRGAFAQDKELRLVGADGRQGPLTAIMVHEGKCGFWLREG